MTIETMQMEPYEARKRYLEYRASVRRHREQRRRLATEEANEVHRKRTLIEREEDDLRAAYRAMALGQRVLCLTRVMRAAGFDDQGRPVLAFARSDWEWCFYEGRGDRLTFRAERFTKQRLEVPVAPPQGKQWTAGRALVPPVPPRFRPEKLGEYVTLWEAEWLPAPPLDPLLLKQIGTTMFVVVAQWDLTPVERAVLEGRFA